MKKGVIYLFAFILLTVAAAGDFLCDQTDSTVVNSSGSSCSVSQSTIINSSLTNTNASYSTIRYSTVENMTIYDATIINNILASGWIVYNGYTFYPVINLSYIYAGNLPISLGSIYSTPTIVRDGISVNFSYSSPEIGYSVIINLSNLDNNSVSLVALHDDGIYPDVAASDSTLSVNYSVSQTNNNSDGIKIVEARVSDGKGNTVLSNMSIILDNTLPSAEIIISPIGQAGFAYDGNEYTSVRLVGLSLNFSDTYGVEKCRIGNSATSFSSWESCTGTKSWLLSEGDGLKTIYYNVMDNAGNNITVTDTIMLNSTGAGLDTTAPSLPAIVDNGGWSNSTSTLTFAWYNSTDPESSRLGLPIFYKYKFNSSSEESIIDWNASVGTATSITLTDLSLDTKKLYFLSVIAFNTGGYESNASISRAIGIDPSPPEIDTVETSSTQTWSSSSDVYVNWSASDTGSGVEGYSYILSRYAQSDLGNIVLNTTSKNYTNLASGKYYFYLKAKDFAGNWGNLSSSIEIGVDGNIPTTPQTLNRTIITSESNLNFSWTQSRDLTSAIANYTLNITYENGSTFFYGNVGIVTNY